MMKNKELSRNPYYNIAGIDDPALFFGRLDDLEKLVPTFISDRPQCCSIVGQRKIGKTSLVQHLMRPSTIKEFGLSLDHHVFIYFNCQRYPTAMDNLPAFYNIMIFLLDQQIISRGILLGDLELTLTPQEMWEQRLLALEKTELKAIFIFDEFEKAIIRENLIREGLFGTLRSYAQDTSVFSWVTCTRFLLHDLFKEAFTEYQISPVVQKSESDFYNIAPVHVLRLFQSATETEQAILDPLKSRSWKFNNSDVDFILKFGGYFPYFIQRACYHVFNSRLRQIAAVDYKRIMSDLVSESDQVWMDYWKKLDSKQKDLFSVIINDSSQLINDGYNLTRLKDASLIFKTSEGKFAPFSEEFGAFMRTNFHQGYLSIDDVTPQLTEDNIIAMTDDKSTQPKVTNNDPSVRPFNWGSLVVAVLSIGTLLIIVVGILTWTASQLSLQAAILVLIISLPFTLLLSLVVLRLMGLISDKQTISFMNRISDRIPLLSDLANVVLRIPIIGKAEKFYEEDSNSQHKEP